MRYLSLIIILAIGTNTTAQEIPIKPSNLVVDSVDTIISIEVLSKTYYSGNWKDLIANTKNLLSQLEDSVKSFPRVEENDYINIIAVDYIYSSNQQNYSNVLRGVSRDRGNFYQLIVSDTKHDSLSSMYSYKATPDPVISLIPGFIDKVTPFAVSLISKQMVPTESISTTKLFITLSKIETPLESSEISSKVIYKKENQPEIEHESTFINSPDKRISFDLMTGFLFNYNNRYYYKITDGVISENSLDRLVALATVNFHVKKYNPNLKADKFFHLSKLKVFGGLGITPKPVLAGGVGYQIIDGLSLNAGLSGISIDDIKSDDVVGSAPESADDPFDPKFRTAFFVSLSVKFSN